MLSDPSREFPDNTTRAFKVRLPTMVQFDGDWDVGLVSISMPDRGLDLNELFTKDSNDVVRVKYHVKNAKSGPYTLRTEDVKCQTLVQNEGAIVDGIGFMKAVIDKINWQITSTLELTRGRLWIVDSASILLSLVVDWRFTNLNKTFQATVSHSHECCWSTQMW